MPLIGRDLLESIFSSGVIRFHWLLNISLTLGNLMRKESLGTLYWRLLGWNFILKGQVSSNPNPLKEYPDRSSYWLTADIHTMTGWAVEIYQSYY